MANREFIAAKDLPVTEAEEVDVLCVENGELKRKAGASLGGGSEEMDIVLTVDSFLGNYLTENNVTVAEGSMEAVRTAFKEGRNPKGKVIFRSDSSNEYGIYGCAAELPATFYLYGGYIVMGCIGYYPMNDNVIHFYQFYFDETGAITNVSGYSVNGSGIE